MSPAQNMASASPRSPLALADTHLLTIENAIYANAVTEEPAVSIEVDPRKNKSSALEQIQDEIIPNNASEESVSIQGGLARNMSNTLEQILDVLKGKPIAEEPGKYDNLKFWAAYKTVSHEYDCDFVGRAYDDMGNILNFAGIFAVVNSTFIAGMQPDPGDTTNVLLLHLIQITVNGPNSVPDINTLSSSTGYSPSTIWIQTLAYASLAFSVLAAFGAVLGKQWLHSYMTNRGRGTLEERGTFLVLLQISLLLFGLSLSANMWVKQTTISSIIIFTTAFGILFYAGTILVSALRPDSPFQTPGSELFVAICKKMLPKKFTFTPNKFVKSSAVRWVLETPTNPEVVEAAAAIVPRVQWPPNLDVSTAFARLRYIFVAYCDREELYVMFGKAMAHLCVQSVKIHEELLAFGDNKFQSTRNRFIRDAFMAGRAAYARLKNPWEGDAKLKHRASARTALRTMLVHGLSSRLSRPDDEELIWRGDLQWRHSDEREPSCEEFDWLVDYLADDAKNSTDDETEGDALLALSAMHGLGSSTKRRSYIKSLIRCMGSTRPSRVRHSALRAVFEAQEDLASITSVSMPRGVNSQLLNQLSQALLTAVCLNDNPTIHDAGPGTSFYEDRDSCYVRLICALTKDDDWCQRLTRDGHLDRCISLVGGACFQFDPNVRFCVLVIFGKIKSSGKDLPFSPTEERWQLLIADAWDFARYLIGGDDYVDGIPALVTATRLYLTRWYDVPRGWLADLPAKVQKALVDLQERQAILVNDGVAQATVNAALSSMQGLYYDALYRITEDQNTQQGNGREATARKSSSQPRSGLCRALRKFKKNVTKKVSHSRHRIPAVRNADNEGASLSQNIWDESHGCVNQGASGEPTSKVQAASSGLEEGPAPQLVDAKLRGACEGKEIMRLLEGHVTPVASAANNGPASLAVADDFRTTYLQSLKNFNTLSPILANAHPDAKMALGALHTASEIILDQTERDQLAQSLLDKFEEVYCFMSQDDTLGQISSKLSIVEQIAQQTLECACFIRDYSEKKNSWMRLGKNVVSETDDLIARYNNALDRLMQQLHQEYPPMQS
ncbi:hypothetical protein BDR03DRAFT_1089823 [Suillus americanus]|nr:hypothetical protein BDR03DRAFT_1089823 [Suillus americanus]